MSAYPSRPRLLFAMIGLVSAASLSALAAEHASGGQEQTPMHGQQQGMMGSEMMGSEMMGNQP